MSNSYRQGALTDNIVYPTDRGPYRQLDPYRRCAISTDKGPLLPYMIQAMRQVNPQNEALHNKRLLQTLCNSYSKGTPTNKGPLHDIFDRLLYLFK